MLPPYSSRLWPSACVGKVSTPSSRASAASRSCVGPIHWPPTSTTLPSPMSWLRSRPPTRSRASSTITDAPRAVSARAAASPARPAPSTTTSASRVSGPATVTEPNSLPWRVRMPPGTHSAEREEERRLNTRTLTIASVASASAAAVTSQLWIAGTWIAAAFTPVLVALISEAMHRPTERIARAWTSDREAYSSRAISPTRAEPTAVTGTPGPVRVYRTGDSGRGSPSLLTKRRIAIGSVAATAAIACVIGLVTLTTVDLVSGGSVGKGSSRFTLGGGGDANDTEQEVTPQREQRQEQAPDQQQITPSEQPPETTEPAPEEPAPAETAPVTPPAEGAPAEPVPEAPTTP